MEKLILTYFLNRVGGELGSVEERRLSSRENVYSCSVTIHLVNLYRAGRRDPGNEVVD